MRTRKLGTIKNWVKAVGFTVVLMACAIAMFCYAQHWYGMAIGILETNGVAFSIYHIYMYICDGISLIFLYLMGSWLNYVYAWCHHFKTDLWEAVINRLG